MPDEVTVGTLLDVFKTLHRKRRVRLKIDGEAPVRITGVTIALDDDREIVVIEVERHAGRGA